MKKYLFMAAVAVLATSCVTTTKTARTESVPYSMYNATVADLEVSPKRITYTIEPSVEIQKGGINNVKQAVIMEALNANGNADMLLEPQFVISHKKGPFGIFINKVTSITVTGRPATYKNFRSMDDKVWCDPVFRGGKGTNFHIFQK
ncbi:MAG: hypothetical protein J1E02_04005 [Coprobacter sp.]|nr:hypothetical protein [Coprobacter sp.]